MWVLSSYITTSAVAAVNWLRFTASVASVPAVTPVILPVFPSLMVTLPNFGDSAICSDRVPVSGSITVVRLAPE
ncbi:hypothetical protein D3C78_1922090 [compost metagenome]